MGKNQDSKSTTQPSSQSNGSSQSASNSSQKSSSSNSSAQQSHYSIAKEGWGSRSNFQSSHGLKMTPEDIDEGTAILDEMEKSDRR